MKKLKDIKCEFTSELDNGSVVTTPCVYDPNTGEVYSEISKWKIPEGSLEREYITLPDGDEKKICNICHSFVIKTVMGTRADLSYGECQECSDPDCGDED